MTWWQIDVTWHEITITWQHTHDCCHNEVTWLFHENNVTWPLIKDVTWLVVKICPRDLLHAVTRDLSSKQGHVTLIIHQLSTKLHHKAWSHPCLSRKITKIFLDGPQPLDRHWEFPRIYGILFGITSHQWRNTPKFSHVAIYGMRKKSKAKTGICMSRHINALASQIFSRITPLNWGHVNIFKLMSQNGCLW